MCHVPGSLLHILSAWPHLILTSIPWGWYNYPHLRESKWNQRHRRFGGLSTHSKRVGGVGFGLRSGGPQGPGSQLLFSTAAARTSEPNHHEAFLPGKAISLENKTDVQPGAASAVLSYSTWWPCCGLLRMWAEGWAGSRTGELARLLGLHSKFRFFALK